MPKKGVFKWHGADAEKLAQIIILLAQGEKKGLPKDLRGDLSSGLSPAEAIAFAVAELKRQRMGVKGIIRLIGESLVVDSIFPHLPLDQGDLLSCLTSGIPVARRAWGRILTEGLLPEMERDIKENMNLLPKTLQIEVWEKLRAKVA